MAKQPTETKVTRIKASDSTEKRAVAREEKPKVVKKTAEMASHSRKKTPNPFAAFWQYLKGSWYELRQVRWPDRQSTWKMTGALIAFTLFFVVVITVLDIGFEKLFTLIMGK